MHQISSSEYFVQTSQGNISVRDNQAEGPAVLMLHANSLCKEVFGRQFDSPLAQKYRFVAIDLPGHGKSDNAKDPAATYTMLGYAKIVIEVIEKLGLEKPVVVGWSLGGHVGLQLLQTAQKLAGILISGTPPAEISPEGLAEAFLPSISQTLAPKTAFTQEEAESFTQLSGIDPVKHPFAIDAVKRTDGLARECLMQSIARKLGGNQKEIVETNETPLCVIQGADDKGIDNAYFEKVAFKNLFKKTVFIVKGTAHAVLWEKSKEFNQILADFLEHVSSQAK